MIDSTSRRRISSDRSSGAGPRTPLDEVHGGHGPVGGVAWSRAPLTWSNVVPVSRSITRVPRPGVPETFLSRISHEARAESLRDPARREPVQRLPLPPRLETLPLRMQTHVRTRSPRDVSGSQLASRPSVTPPAVSTMPLVRSTCRLAPARLLVRPSGARAPAAVHRDVTLWATRKWRREDLIIARDDAAPSLSDYELKAAGSVPDDRLSVGLESAADPSSLATALKAVESVRSARVPSGERPAGPIAGGPRTSSAILKRRRRSRSWALAQRASASHFFASNLGGRYTVVPFTRARRFVGRRSPYSRPSVR